MVRFHHLLWPHLLPSSLCQFQLALATAGTPELPENFEHALSSAWYALPSAHGLLLHFFKVSLNWSLYEIGSLSSDSILLIHISSLVYQSHRMHHLLTRYIFYLSI